MSKKQMLPFLTEWLITHGTEPINMAGVGMFQMETLYKAMRKGYLVEVSVGAPVMMKLTKKGITYLQENQK